MNGHESHAISRIAWIFLSEIEGAQVEAICSSQTHRKTVPQRNVPSGGPNGYFLELEVHHPISIQNYQPFPELNNERKNAKTRAGT
jgi:hypothetical protein